MIAREVIIDARPRIGGRPIALTTAHRRPLLVHLVQYVLRSGAGRVTVLAEPGDVAAVREAVSRVASRSETTGGAAATRSANRPIWRSPVVEVVAHQPPGDGAVRLEADVVYDLPRLARALRRGTGAESEALWRITTDSDFAQADEELARAIDWYPLSRRYLRPMARWMARRLAARGVAPTSVTLAGFALAVVAAVVMVASATVSAGAVVIACRAAAAAFLIFSWCLDQTDGYLARLRRWATPRGAWLDANLDELTDLGLHAAVAAACVLGAGGAAPVWWALAFVCGKYLFMYGERPPSDAQAAGRPAAHAHQVAQRHRWRRILQLPADADVRVHLLAAAMLLGLLEAELAFVAIYYNARWMARHVRMACRLGGGELP
ncbi:MAG: CDP-alcohol phosphatidyltransferase family protein [Pirellulales bacterium]